MYKIINNLPIDYKFSNKSKEELKLYADWFEHNKVNRLNELYKIVTSQQEFANWELDFTPHSLKDLGKWLCENINVETVPEIEYEAKRAKLPIWIEVSNWDLTNKSRSILIDVGIYFGEVFIHSHKKLHWKQYFSKIKDDINHGHMVIKMRKNSLNPIRNMINVGFGIIKKNKSDSCLYDLYKVWEEYI